MKICMLAYTFYETDNRVRRYAETLVCEGHRVDAIALSRYKKQPRFEIIDGVHVYRIQDRIVEEKGKLVYLIRLIRFFLRSCTFISKKHLASPYDLIHVHSVPDFEVFAAILPRITGAAVILDIHDIVPEFYKNKFKTDERSIAYKGLLLAERISVMFSHHTLISNHIWEKRLVARCGCPEKITTIMNYPDDRIFKPYHTPRDDGRFIIVYPGTLNWHQGLDLAVEAMKVVTEHAPNAILHIYGDGPLKEPLRKRIRELNLEQKVILKSIVPIDQVPKIMAGADLGIIPKRNDGFGGEAFSTKTLEFMSVGVPIIVARTRIDDYYFNDSVVKFFEPGNVDDLAKAMLEMIHDKALRERLTRNALKFVESYTWKNNKHIYLDLVYSLVGIKR